MGVECDRAWIVGLTKTASGGAQVRMLATVPGRDLFHSVKRLIACCRVFTL
jgi:hypothetical protein